MMRKPLAPSGLGTSGLRVSRPAPVPPATAAAVARTRPGRAGPRLALVMSAMDPPPQAGPYTRHLGVPVLPCPKIPLTSHGVTSILAIRTGEQDAGVIGLHPMPLSLFSSGHDDGVFPGEDGVG